MDSQADGAEQPADGSAEGGGGPRAQAADQEAGGQDCAVSGPASVAGGEPLLPAARELRKCFPRVWAIVSSADGQAVQPRALASYLRGLCLSEAAEAPQDEALRCLLAYARGDGGGLDVRDSLIEGAGQGLFASRSFREGELLCVYSGTAVPFLRVLRGEANTDYLMGGFGAHSVNAADHPAVLARYINDHADPARINVRFVKLRRELRALVLATRDVAAGEEIYAAYGEGYWRARSKHGKPPCEGGDQPVVEAASAFRASSGEDDRSPS